MLLPNRLPHAAAALLIALLLQGCSTVRLAYNQADTLLYWRLDSYADFSDAQAPRVRDGLAQYHQWHRRTQLPAYADLLQRLRPQLAEPISPEQACAVFDQLRGAFAAALDPAQWSLVGMAGELSEEQLRHIERKQAGSDAEFRKEWIAPPAEQLAARRFDEVLSRAETFYGSLDEPQKAALRSALAASSFDPARSYAERLRRQADLRQVLRRIRSEQPDLETARALLKGYIDRALDSPDPAHQHYAQTLRREGCTSFSRLHAATTPAQRARAMQALKSYEDDFRALAAQR